MGIFGTSVIYKNYMENLQKCLIPTSKITSSTSKYCGRDIGKYAQYALLANSLLKTISLNQENIREGTILDSGATSFFLVVDAPCDDIRLGRIPLTVRQTDRAQVQGATMQKGMQQPM